MPLFGRLFHYAFDLMLISTLLAGIERNTGLTVALEKVPNKEFRRVVKEYLEVGQFTYDFLVVTLGRSSRFKRIR
ncbi:hypothetical protein NliqN6_0776 [Naganishia liquefaciens]|uniref:DUF1748-domain-containing protein n=1 Tax=Naganishia liquefaciens TaxID=104408 RepID=A0A8H3TP11_9TREE|nr:hypothetical protein NliqN6_0776 [Naganishia liquefaciens]